MSVSLYQRIVTLGVPGKSVDQPNGHGQSLPFRSSVAPYVCRLSLCIVSYETGGVYTSKPGKIHP